MPAFGSASAISWARLRRTSSRSLRSNSRRLVPAGSPHWADLRMIRSGTSAELRAFPPSLLTLFGFDPRVLTLRMRSRVAEKSSPAKSDADLNDSVGHFGGASRLPPFAVNTVRLRSEGIDAQNALARSGGVVTGQVKCEGIGIA